MLFSFLIVLSLSFRKAENLSSFKIFQLVDEQHHRRAIDHVLLDAVEDVAECLSR